MGKWNTVKVADLGRIVTGKTPSTKDTEYWGGDIPFITPKDIQGLKHIQKAERSITEKGMMAVSGAILPPNAICVSCIGNIGYVGMTIQKSVSNQQINSVVVNENNDPNFVYYLMKNLWLFFKNYEGQSTTLSILNKSQFSKIEVAAPELDIQKKIAGVLSCIDKKIENNLAINDNLQAQAIALFAHYYEQADNAVPFTDCVQVLGGGTPKTGESSYWNGDIPFFTPKDVGAPYTLETEKSITESGLDHCNSHLYPVNTVFVTARGTVGKVAMAGVPMAMNQSCYAIVGRGIEQLLTYYYTLVTVERLRHKASGAVFDAITTRDFESETIFKLLDKDAGAFLSIATPVFQKILANTIECQKLAALRDALLPKLMSGEIDVSNVNL